MPDELLFYFVKEYGKPQSMAGKIWQIKILSGTLSVGNKVSLHGVTVFSKKGESPKVDATIKQIRRESSGESESDIITASQGDIVTINISKCSVNRKKIDKRNITVGKRALGLRFGEPCDNINSFKVKFEKHEAFVEQLEQSLQRQSLFPKKLKKQKQTNEPTAYMVSLLWFGRKIPITVGDVVCMPQQNGTIVNFRLLNDQTLPIPQNQYLRNLMKRAIIKDRYCEKQQARWKKGIHCWKYYVGEMQFEN